MTKESSIPVALDLALPSELAGFLLQSYRARSTSLQATLEYRAGGNCRMRDLFGGA